MEKGVLATVLHKRGFLRRRSFSLRAFFLAFFHFSFFVSFKCFFPSLSTFSRSSHKSCAWSPNKRWALEGVVVKSIEVGFNSYKQWLLHCIT